MIKNKIRVVESINTNAVYIPSIDGKDLFISNHYIDGTPNGYSLKLKTGEYNIKKFINTLDFSLDLLKLRETYERVYRRKDFSFYKNKKEYSPKVINVTFKYSNKEFNKLRNNTYVKFGYSVEDSDFHDSVCIMNGELIAIRTDESVESPVSDDLISPYFYLDNGVYKAKSNIKTLNNVADIRLELYTNGFICDGIKYVRFKRSSGSSRVGKCLFIDERLYSRIHKWEMCGIKINNGDEVDLASLEPYIALTLSSIIDTIQIYPENILVIDDYKSVFADKVIATRLSESGKLISRPETVEITNNIWDGQSLMDRSMFLEFLEKQKYRGIENPVEHGMLLLRARFFKSCCFNANIQDWFADNNITDVSQLNGFTLAKKIEDIKLITTPSSIKYLKFGTLEKWLNTLEPTFGVVKHEKKTHFFDGRMVQTHYQLINTLQLTYDEVESLVKPSLDYIRGIKEDPAFLRHQIGYQYCTPDDTYFNAPITSRNDIIYKMLGVNDKFQETKLYRQFRDDLVKSLIKDLRCGHILVHGNYSTLCGNPIEMLKQAIGCFNGEPIFIYNTICCTKFLNNADILGSRSPHVTMGNILVTKNMLYNIITKYMNPTEEIVYVNSINENLLERLSGADFDSDTVLLTDNMILIKAATRNYTNFPVPTKFVESTKVRRKYTSSQQADLDIKTSVNKIGEIINLSQELNSLLWERLNNGECIDDVMDLYCDIAQLDVMSNLEIDSAKRENPANNTYELQCLKKKYDKRDVMDRHIRPLFFKYIDGYKGYRDEYYVYEKVENEFTKVASKIKYQTAKSLKKEIESDIHIERGRMSYELYHTAMDYLEKAIDKFSKKRLPKLEYLPFSDMLIPIDEIDGYVKYPQVHTIIQSIRDLKGKITDIWNNENLSIIEKRNFSYEQQLDLNSYIQSISINIKTMRYLLSLIDSKEYSDISRLLFYLLLDIKYDMFFELLLRSKKTIGKLVENKNGTINILGFLYEKEYV